MERLTCGLLVGAYIALLAVAPAHSSNAALERALIGFKNHISAGMSYVEYAPATANLNTEIELAERGKTLSGGAAHELAMLKADAAIVGEVWNLRFGPLGSGGDSFTFCGSEVGKLFASTGTTFKAQGLMDADLKTEDLSGQCAYYTDGTIATLLSAVAKQADKSLDALTAVRSAAHKHH
jgi:hypothetical protein